MLEGILVQPKGLLFLSQIYAFIGSNGAVTVGPSSSNKGVWNPTKPPPATPPNYADLKRTLEARKRAAVGNQEGMGAGGDEAQVDGNGASADDEEVDDEEEVKKKKKVPINRGQPRVHPLVRQAWN